VLTKLPQQSYGFPSIPFPLYALFKHSRHKLASSLPPTVLYFIQCKFIIIGSLLLIILSAVWTAKNRILCPICASHRFSRQRNRIPYLSRSPHHICWSLMRMRAVPIIASASAAARRRSILFVVLPFLELASSTSYKAACVSSKRTNDDRWGLSVIAQKGEVPH